ncbi:LysM peptidoglycan-binding domain-containing protein [Kaistella sp. PBT33-4]|uniref:amino acid ABC transporter substrate-binding protein n=1 Tax=Kaistella sp. PBT33-4 TaxID=3032000 RepID=UPI0023D8828A|nr:LysM peptidoglycan-binding domain-containing protein [Kaistella sp. PBT33-4]MDF0719396.1 LysM peptidoglycan-binding domain-containing protein [Kaistella sp. PBT33-4]
MKKIFIMSVFLLFSSVSAQKKMHTVAKGDNAYNIARKYGISLDEFYKLNPAAKSGNLKIGDKVTVKNSPAASASSAVSYITVQSGQTLYGLLRQYKISEAELRKLNPGLESNLKIGDRIALPASNVSRYADSNTSITSEKAKPSAPVSASANTYTSSGISSDNFVTYTVQSGDTTFGIVNKFSVSLDDLIRLNPDLAKGLRSGMVLKVKPADKAYVKKSGDELNVVVMLPFGYESGDSKYRTMSLDFLSGAKLAIERNARRGQKLNVKIVDAGSEATFKNSLTQINRDNTDLIVGPLFKSSILEVLDYVKDSKIPIVAPFANSDDLYGFSNLIIVETNEQTYADRIIQEVKTAHTDQRIFIVADGDRTHANYIRTGLIKALKNPNIQLVNSPSEITADTNMMTGQSVPVIAVLASNNDSTGQAFAEKMIAMSGEVQGMKAFSMFYVPAFEKKADELGKASLVYVMDRTINTEGSFEKEILSEFNRKYCKTPGKYAIIGFDVMNDMLSRENSRGEIFSQMGKTQTQLATKFEFERIQRNGAYVNTGYRVVRLVP